MTTPIEIATQYTVSMLPVDHEEFFLFSLSVEWCGNAPPGFTIAGFEDRQWAVRRMGRCLSRTNKWVWEPQPSSRTPTFLKRHRFTLDEALPAARKHVDKIIINGMRYTDVLARRA